MSLSENQETTRTTMAQEFTAKMEELFPLDEEMSEDDKLAIRLNWNKLGHAVAATLPSILAHIVNNAEIGTVESEVVGELATQSNCGTGLIQ